MPFWQFSEIRVPNSRHHRILRIKHFFAFWLQQNIVQLLATIIVLISSAIVSTWQACKLGQMHEWTSYVRRLQCLWLKFVITSLQFFITVTHETKISSWKCHSLAVKGLYYFKNTLKVINSTLSNLSFYLKGALNSFSLPRTMSPTPPPTFCLTFLSNHRPEK